jgi:hypothetical protein
MVVVSNDGEHRIEIEFGPIESDEVTAPATPMLYMDLTVNGRAAGRLRVFPRECKLIGTIFIRGIMRTDGVELFALTGVGGVE